MKNAKLLLGFALVLFVLNSCNNDKNSTSPIAKISAKTTYTGSKTGRLASNIALSSFKVNLKEIKFEYDDDFENNHEGDDDNDGFYDGDDNFKLRGPFEIELLNGPVNLVATNIPQDVFEEVEFKLDKNEMASSEMFNKSIQIKGTIDGKPFVFWHNIEEEFEVDYKDAVNNITVGENNVSIVLNFDLDTALANIDLSSAKDGNGNGIIEISTIDTDGNQSLANQFKELIKGSCELENERDDDYIFFKIFS